MMEKYDGIRCYWNGKNLLINGMKMTVPPKYNFPSIPFEGELWYVDAIYSGDLLMKF
jgi:hypothetical protein